MVERGDPSEIRPDWRPKVGRILDRLHVIVSPDEMDIPGFGFHRLKGNRADTFALTVSRNWRVTFCWDDDGPYSVDLEDYHG